VAVLARDTIRERLRLSIEEAESLVITPLPPEDAFDFDSVDLRLGCHFLLPQVPPEPVLKSIQELGRSHRRLHVPLGSFLVIPSHETVLGATLEFIKLPNDVSGQILTKSSVARNFMVIETAPWIHPCYRGCLTLEIANVSNTPLIVYPGSPIGQLVLISNDKTSPSEMPEGSYLGPVYPEEPPKKNLAQQMQAWGISEYRHPADGKWHSISQPPPIGDDQR
jgi:dCTP deaminase